MRQTRCGRRWALVAGLVATSCLTREELSAHKAGQEQILGELREVRAELAALRAQPPRPPAAAPAAAPPRRPDPGKRYSVALGDAPTQGPKDAWVTVVVGSDFQCPFCQRGRDRLRELRQAYGDDLRIAFKHNPLSSLHPRAMAAAVAAECARQEGKFWDFHDRLFDQPSAFGEAELIAHAQKVGLKAATFARCRAEPAAARRVEADRSQLEALGAGGTPSFFINGRFLSGARPLEQFRVLVDEELARARASGVPRAAYYEKQVVEGGQRGL